MKKFDERARVLSNQKVADSTFLIRLHAPLMSEWIRPGQFVQLDCGDSSLTLRRPFSVFLAQDGEIQILYQVVGKGSRILTKATRGDELSVLGPLGGAWPIQKEVKRSLLVAGGLGAAPLAGLVAELESRGCEVDLAQGAQSESKLVAREFYLSQNCNYTICTDDGSYGVKGLVSAPVSELLEKHDYDVAYVCGPEVMMKNVSSLLLDKGIKTYVSLERRMACGLGACLSCVVNTTEGLKKACVDGPIFSAEEVEW